MGSIFIKTLIMFVLSFIIAMVVAVLIYWIRQLLTSVRMNSFFDEKSKNMMRRAIRIHKIHDKKIRNLSAQDLVELQPHGYNLYEGVDSNYEPVERHRNVFRSVVRRKRTVKKHKNK